MRKRILSIFLVLTFLACLIPSTALAAAPRSVSQHHTAFLYSDAFRDTTEKPDLHDTLTDKNYEKTDVAEDAPAEDPAAAGDDIIPPDLSSSDAEEVQEEVAEPNAGSEPVPSAPSRSGRPSFYSDYYRADRNETSDLEFESSPLDASDVLSEEPASGVDAVIPAEDDMPTPPVETPESIAAAKEFASRIQPDTPVVILPESDIELNATGPVTVSSGETLYAEAGMTVYNNGGLVYNNLAVVYNNGGIVYNNSGTVYNNAGTVYANGGTTYNNSGTVYDNGAPIHSSGPDGLVVAETPADTPDTGDTGPAWSQADDPRTYEDGWYDDDWRYDDDWYDDGWQYDDGWYDDSWPYDDDWYDDDWQYDDGFFYDDGRQIDGSAEQPTAEEPAAAEEGAAEFLAAYAPVFESYRAFLNGQEPAGTDLTDRGDQFLPLGETGISTLCRSGDMLGYALMDLDNNGIPELLIGAETEADAKDFLIYDMFTLNNGDVERVLASSKRQHYQLMEEDLILFSCSGKSTDYYCGAYELVGSNIELVAGVAMTDGVCYQLVGNRYDEYLAEENQRTEISPEEYDVILSLFQDCILPFALEPIQLNEAAGDGVDTLENAVVPESESDPDPEQLPVTLYTPEELADLAQEYYYAQFGYFPPEAEVFVNEDGSYTIHLYEIVDLNDGYIHTATSAWYVVDEYGVGTDALFGDPVELGK